MQSREAYEKDFDYFKRTGENPFYVEKEDSIEYIFGLDSGFAYSSPVDPEKEAESMFIMMKARTESE